MEQEGIWKSPDKGKTKGRAKMMERDGYIYLLPGTELCPPQPMMSDKNKARRSEIIEKGFGYIDSNTKNVVLTKEYQINSRENAWRLIMGSNDGNQKWELTPTNEESMNLLIKFIMTNFLGSGTTSNQDFSPSKLKPTTYTSSTLTNEIKVNQKNNVEDLILQLGKITLNIEEVKRTECKLEEDKKEIIKKLLNYK